MSILDDIRRLVDLAGAAQTGAELEEIGRRLCEATAELYERVSNILSERAEAIEAREELEDADTRAAMKPRDT